MITTMSITGISYGKRAHGPNRARSSVREPRRPTPASRSAALIRRDPGHWRSERENTSLIALMASNASTSAVVIRVPIGA